MPVPLEATPCKPATAKQQLTMTSCVSDKLASLQLDASDHSPTSVVPTTLARSVSDSSSEDFDLTVKKIIKTEHKLREENGEFAEEPLLKENPHRFVLFPIQDNDVRKSVL